MKPLWTREEVVGALATLRKDWEMGDRVSLIDKKGSVGLILADLSQSLALAPDEQKQVFGGRLLKELEAGGVIGNGNFSQVSKIGNDWQPETF